MPQEMRSVKKLHEHPSGKNVWAEWVNLVEQKLSSACLTVAVLDTLNKANQQLVRQ
jgi:hypothetical protein